MTTENPTAAPTRDEVWAYLLRLWKTQNLPTPTDIEVSTYGVFEVRLPDNERGQTDRWANALGLPANRFEWTGWNAWYSSGGSNQDRHSPVLSGWSGSATCSIDMNADPSAHWSGPSEADPRTQLAEYLTSTAAGGAR